MPGPRKPFTILATTPINVTLIEKNAHNTSKKEKGPHETKTKIRVVRNRA